MRLVVPDFYDSFTCIADRCKDTCCAGWEVDIDEATYDYYMQVEGSFGERLRTECVVEDEEAHFCLKENGRCPFLNDRNLCDIVLHLGEEALSEVCTEYPRFTMEYEDVREKSLAISCEEVGRLLFSTTKPFTLVTHGDAPKSVCEKEMLRNQLLELVKNRSLPFAERVQGYLQKSGCEGEKLVGYEWSSNIDIEGIRRRLDVLEGLEILDEEWVTVYEQLKCLVADEAAFRKAAKQYLEYESSHEDMGIWYEQLLSYFTFRYFMRSYYDENTVSKAQMCVLFVQVLRDMAMLSYASEPRLDTDKKIDLARIFSKEVEHSDENVGFVEEECIFGVYE